MNTRAYMCMGKKEEREREPPMLHAKVVKVAGRPRYCVTFSNSIKAIVGGSRQRRRRHRRLWNRRDCSNDDSDQMTLLSNFFAFRGHANPSRTACCADNDKLWERERGEDRFIFNDALLHPWAMFSAPPDYTHRVPILITAGQST